MRDAGSAAAPDRGASRPARIVEVGEKDVTRREATAEGVLHTTPEAVAALIAGTRKGDPLEAAIESNIDALMDESLSIHAFAGLGLSQKICHSLFDHPRPNATLYIRAAATLQDDRLDPL